MTAISALDTGRLSPPPSPQPQDRAEGAGRDAFGGSIDGGFDRPAGAPKTDEDITVEEWGLCGDVMGVHVDTGDGDDDIKLTIHRDGTSDLWVNGEHKGTFSKEQTDVLTIRTGEGSDTVVIEDDRAFQDLPVPTVENNGANGTDSVQVRYPGHPPAEFPLEPGQRSA